MASKIYATAFEGRIPGVAVPKDISFRWHFVSCSSRECISSAPGSLLFSSGLGASSEFQYSEKQKPLIVLYHLVLASSPLG